MPLFSRITPLLIALILAAPLLSQQPRILVYTRNYTPDGKGYVHDNIATSVEAIRRMGAESHFTVDTSDSPDVFTDDNLKQYAALVFSNSNNEAFTTDDQRAAFRRYIQSHHGFVALHSGSGSERSWPYYWQVVGGKFVEHPVLQTFTVHVTDSDSPITKGLDADFAWTDECYFTDHQSPDIHPLLTTDRTKLRGLDKMRRSDPNTYPNPLPLAWTQTFDGSREFYLALGHRKEDYANPILYNLIRRGILWSINAQSASSRP
ncbi:ThuA domain-containing protein [Edaphobacter albus]|uniref:ThuA domain-containing protein n=1 Tax=Edaphobacter sp. 4G125 TaxID=2763071 RepID=UPI0016462E5C|nr:ThuA domain-containing protein [Edaphobacter sp. 4G125]QNI35492.1 ThuA domain-containing protein [Edaphobacter sp. 4G125]